MSVDDKKPNINQLADEITFAAIRDITKADAADMGLLHAVRDLVEVKLLHAAYGNKININVSGAVDRLKQIVDDLYGTPHKRPKVIPNVVERPYNPKVGAVLLERICKAVDSKVKEFAGGRSI